MQAPGEESIVVPTAGAAIALPAPYDWIATLAASADARTYKALDRETGQLVALKALSLGQLQGWKRLELFAREARTLAHLQHPRIPRLRDFRQSDDGLEAWLVSDWVEGESLAERIAKRWLPDETTALRLAEQILWILDYLHGFQPPVIHRDIKPSNLILDPENRLHLIDFGGVQELLRPSGGGGSTIIGTFGYMAPEQFAGRAVPASDLYGLGTTLIHLLGGTAPAQLPQKNLQLMFQGLVQASGGGMRWLTQLVRPDLADRYANVSIALQQLYALTGLEPGTPPQPGKGPIQLSAPLQALLAKPATEASTASAAHRLAQPGDDLQGYRIETVLAQGSQSAAYAATRLNDEEPVVLKVLYFASLGDWKQRELFEREIETLRKLRHPRIPAFLDSFSTPEQDLCLVTARIQAQNLDQKLRGGWRPREDEVRRIARQTLALLRDLHGMSPPLVHRDLKPSNLLLDDQDQLWLIDFGGVQERQQASGGSTVMGTFGYMAPEAYLRRAVPASDLYSLGATLIRLLSGREPAELPQRELRLDFRAAVQASEGFKDWLDNLIAPDPGQRFRSAAQALTLLEDMDRLTAAPKPPPASFFDKPLPPGPGPLRQFFGADAGGRRHPLPDSIPDPDAGVTDPGRVLQLGRQVPGWEALQPDQLSVELRGSRTPLSPQALRRLRKLCRGLRCEYVSKVRAPMLLSVPFRLVGLLLLFMLLGIPVISLVEATGIAAFMLLMLPLALAIFGGFFVAVGGLAILSDSRLLNQTRYRWVLTKTQWHLESAGSWLFPRRDALSDRALSCERIVLDGTPVWVLILHPSNYAPEPLLFLLRSAAEAEAFAAMLQACH